MSLYAISDLHLSAFHKKEMSHFDSVWENHSEKIRTNWLKKITDNDTVLIPGDISWGMRLDEAKPDLDFINSLTGQKIITSGNHDYWWGSTATLNNMYDSILFLKTGFANYEGYGVCSAKGWVCPNDTKYSDNDHRLYQREARRLDKSIKLATDKGYEKIIVMLHFPPTNDKKEPSNFTKIINENPVHKVIYGHLHGESSFFASLQGENNHREYVLVSADYIGFDPVLILA